LQISKKTGTAPERNKLRRRFKAIFEHYDLKTSPVALIIRSYPEASKLSFEEINALCALICKKNGIMALEKKQLAEGSAPSPL
jgi:ribonuclease P protein component